MPAIESITNRTSSDSSPSSLLSDAKFTPQMRQSPSILVDATGATERRGGCKEMKQERSRVVLRIEEDGKKEVRKEANSRPYKKENETS